MGIGTQPPSNQVFYDNETGQYYTVGRNQNPETPADNYGSNYINYINAGQPMVQGTAQSSKPPQVSMVATGMDRAQAAYDALMSGMGTNPAYNQYAMFPGMQMQSQPMTSLPMYGAGRFLSPAQAQDTGGVLGINSTQS
jgi:hypothetical protein